MRLFLPTLPYRRIVLVAAALLSASCAERTPPAKQLASWTVNATPLLEITDDDPGGEVVLGSAVHVSRLPDGGVLVTDRGLNALRFFSSDGQLQRTVGRQGSGPGEFAYLRVASRCGDSLYAEDIATRRVTVVAMDGTVSRTMSTNEFAGGNDAFLSACNANGLFVHHGWGAAFDPSVRGRQRGRVAVWIASADGARVAQLDSVNGQEHVGAGDGAPRALLRLPDTDLRATPADLERAKRLDTLGQDARTQERTRADWELDTPPTTLPPYDALIADRDDHLWVRRHPVAGQTLTPWLVFDSHGVHVATVSLPAVLTVHEIGRDYIAGIVLDPETGRHAVQLLGLARAPAP